MNILSTIVTIILFLSLYKVVPSDYHKAVVIGMAGAVIPYITTRLLLFFELKKFASLFSWLLLYISAGVYSYLVNNIELMLFSFGAVINIILCVIIGGKVTVIKPFSRVRYKAVITPYISIAVLIISLLLLTLVYAETLSLQILVVLGTLLYIISVLNIDFFKRLNNVIHYVFKIDIEELKKNHRENTIKVLLREISPLWTRNRAVISLQALADNTWLIDQPKKESIVWEFSNDDIRFFYETEIDRLKYRDEFKNAVGEILSFLDNYGNCPSVVKEQSKSFGKYGYADEKTTFDILYNQTLINHTLQICRLMIKDSKVLQGINLEKMLLTALGHDIGKAAAFNKIDGYMTGDHPNTSIMLIETRFNYFNTLSYAEEVMKMIKNHHGTPSAATPLLQDFKEYDSKARREYLKEYFKQQETAKTEELAASHIAKPVSSVSDNHSSTQEVKSVISNTSTTSTVERPVIPKQEDTADSGFIPSFAVSEEKTVELTNTQQEVADTKQSKYDEPLKKLSSSDTLYADLSNSDIPDSYTISSFFDIHEFLKTVSKQINIINKGKYNYITVNGDLLLCYTASVILEVKKAARMSNVLDIAQLKDNEIGMSFTEYCRKLGILHTDWIQEGYYQGNFSLTDIDGNVLKTGRYIPLRIDAFSEYGSYADYEDRKKGDLVNIVNTKVATKEEMFQNV